jgi:hypothetical protein
MKRILILLIIIGLAALGAKAQTVTGTGVMAGPFVANCDQGQSLNGTLSRLAKHSPATVLVSGTCTEFVQINGFEGRTLKGLPGATLQQPITDPGNGLLIQVLSIEASRSIHRWVRYPGWASAGPLRRPSPLVVLPTLLRSIR